MKEWGRKKKVRQWALGSQCLACIYKNWRGVGDSPDAREVGPWESDSFQQSFPPGTPRPSSIALRVQAESRVCVPSPLPPHIPQAASSSRSAAVVCGSFGALAVTASRLKKARGGGGRGRRVDRLHAA